jgi:hypothetical protein
MKKILKEYSVAIICLLLVWTGGGFYMAGARDLGMFIAGGGIAFLKDPRSGKNPKQ